MFTTKIFGIRSSMLDAIKTGLCFIWCTVTCGCTSLFFYPDSHIYFEPEKIGLYPEDVWIGDNPKLHAWYFKAAEPAFGTVLFLHGNAQNITSHSGSIYWLPRFGFNVLALDYRGYGRSEGHPTISGLIEDSSRALRHLQSHSQSQSGCIFLYGQSLGAAIAINLAATLEPQGQFCAVVAESSFSSFRGIVRDKLSEFYLTWLLQHPLALTIDGGFDPVESIHKISPTPLLLVHGSSDHTIGSHHSTELFEHANAPVEFWKVEGAGHLGIFQDVPMRNELVEFLKQSMPAKD